MNSHKYNRQVIGMTASSTNGPEKKLGIHVLKIETRLLFLTLKKKKMGQGLNVRSETLILLEERVRQALQDVIISA